MISNSSIHHGLGFAIEILHSNNITLDGNVIFDFVKYAVNIETVINVTVNNNWIFNVHSRSIFVQDAEDTTGALLGCANNAMDRCIGLHITNNIAGGVESSGVDTGAFIVMGHECYDYNTPVFKNNIAHSTDGYGASIFLNMTSPTMSTCMESSYFTAYKCQLMGVVSQKATLGIRFTNMVIIDNVNGASANIGVIADPSWANLTNIVFYGETEATDCPIPNYCANSDGKFDCSDKNAIITSIFENYNPGPLINAPPHWPQYKFLEDGSLGGYTNY